MKSFCFCSVKLESFQNARPFCFAVRSKFLIILALFPKRASNVVLCSFCTYSNDHIVVDSAVSCLILLIKFCCFKAYEKQKQTRKNTTQLESKSEEREKVERFKTTENSIVSKPINPFMFGNYLLILAVTLFAKDAMATRLMWLLNRSKSTVKVACYFVYKPWELGTSFDFCL